MEIVMLSSRLATMMFLNAAVVHLYASPLILVTKDRLQPTEYYEIPDSHVFAYEFAAFQDMSPCILINNV
jgi:hypothetical protein